MAEENPVKANGGEYGDGSKLPGLSLRNCRKQFQCLNECIQFSSLKVGEDQEILLLRSCHLVTEFTASAFYPYIEGTDSHRIKLFLRCFPSNLSLSILNLLL